MFIVRLGTELMQERVEYSSLFIAWFTAANVNESNHVRSSTDPQRRR